MTEILPKTKKNEQNTPKVQKMTKIPSKPKNYQNTPKTQKMTEISLKSIYPTQLKYFIS